MNRITTKSWVLHLLLLPAVLAPTSVPAHEALAGWTYPFSCCAGVDCREVEYGKTLTETSIGYMILKTGELIKYQDSRIRNSPDGLFHWCSKQGKDDTPTICLFVPPKSF